MKRFLTTGAALMLSTSMAAALGLDRSNQDITAIFEPGNYVELSFGSIRPSVTGTDLPNPYNPAGYSYANVAEDFTQMGGSIKYQFNDQLSVAVIFDQPFGADVLYGGAPTTWLGGTAAHLESTAITALARYRIGDRFSVHGGVRSENLSAEITLSGVAYSSPLTPADPTDGLSGYNVVLDDSRATGYVLGAAYEIPDIALRVALTYNSAISHEFDTVERIDGAIVNPGSTTTVETPEAWNLDFQTGIAENTLLFGQIRRAFWSQTLVSPAVFAASTGGASLTDIEDGTAITVGVGRRFSEAFSAQVSVGYETPEDSDLQSPLSPTNGNRSVAIGGQYTMDNVVLSAGVRYTFLGDAFPETGTPDVARADFADNSAVALGMSVGFRF